MSLLEQNNTKKERVENVLELDVGNKGNKEYKVKAIRNNAAYARKSEGHLLELYYLVAWKSYLEEKNIWEPASVVQHLKKLISLF